MCAHAADGYSCLSMHLPQRGLLNAQRAIAKLDRPVMLPLLAVRCAHVHDGWSCTSDHVKRFSGQCNRMHETFQWSLYSNLLKRFSGLYMGTNTYVSEYMFGADI
jgi:hypothetical protein